MNMKDLSRDDDFLSHLLVEKLGTGAVPLVVHKMDPNRRLPKTDPEHLLQIVRRVCSPLASFLFNFLTHFLFFSVPIFRVTVFPRSQLVASKGLPQTAIRKAVDELLVFVPYLMPTDDAMLTLM